MQGLYLYTLIVSHKFCKMLSILNKLTLQKALQNCVTNSVFMDKSKNTTTTKQKIKHKNPSRDLLQPKRMCYRCTTKPTESIDY